MTDTYTENKSLALQATGSNNNTWGSDLNNTLGIIDLAFGGVTTISVTGVVAGVYTLSLAQYTPPNIVFTGTISAEIGYVFPPGIGGLWSVYNNTTGTFTMAMGVSSLSVGIPQGQRTLVISDGTTLQIAQTGVSSAPPGALVGLTAISGTAGTFMTSDSAPALNQAISPTWTGTHQFNGESVFVGDVGIYAALSFASGTSLAAQLATVTIPTVATADSSTKAASTAFVKNVLATSPVLAGVPSAPTAVRGNNNTQIATTAFVQQFVAQAGNATNGSFRIGNLLFNYGLFTTPGSSPVTINYTTAYSTAVYGVIPFLVGANQAYDVNSFASLSSWSLNFGASSQAVGWFSYGV